MSLLRPLESWTKNSLPPNLWMSVNKHSGQRISWKIENKCLQWNPWVTYLLLLQTQISMHRRHNIASVMLTGPPHDICDSVYVWQISFDVQLEIQSFTWPGTWAWWRSMWVVTTEWQVCYMGGFQGRIVEESRFGEEVEESMWESWGMWVKKENGKGGDDQVASGLMMVFHSVLLPRRDTPVSLELPSHWILVEFHCGRQCFRSPT